MVIFSSTFLLYNSIQASSKYWVTEMLYHPKNIDCKNMVFIAKQKAYKYTFKKIQIHDRSTRDFTIRIILKKIFSMFQ